MRNLFQCFNFIFLSTFLVGSFQEAHSQDVKITYGPYQIAFNEFFTITLTIENENLRTHSPFPDIPGFNKRGTSSQTSSTFVNGRMTFSQSIIQNYQAVKEGKYTLKAFIMEANDKKANAESITITVGPPIQRRQADPFAYDPFGDFFNRQPATPKEFVDVQEDAFFLLSTDKEDVFVGEGFTLNLSFYVGQANKAQMQFFELGEQLGDILKKIKPANCWEENFSITEIQQSVVEINNKKYTKYKIYEASYFPLNTEPVMFPSVGLKMIKFKVAKNPSFFGNNVQQDFKEFYTKPKIVVVKDLPPHPKKDQVAVGEFKMEERLEKSQMNTGDNMAYSIKIMGIGNISSITEPILPNKESIQFYSPNIAQSIRRENGRVVGHKSFDYYFSPQEPGEYDLSKEINWVFFNTQKSEYDTLKSNFRISVGGISMKNAAIESSGLEKKDSSENDVDNQILNLNPLQDYKIWLNIALLLSTVLVGWTMLKRS